MPNTVTYPFTSRTYVALSIARGIAAGYGHSDLTAAHMALGILREGENPAVAALHYAGVTLPELRYELERALPPPGHPRLGEVFLPITRGEQELVDLAVAEVAGRNDDHLGNEHLLLALLRDPTTPVAQIFSRLGFTYDTAVAQLKLVFVRHA